ncbi:hypothetical protein [Pseudomonas sp. TE21394]
MRTCAYCGPTERRITREHIIPEFIYNFQGDRKNISGWNEVAKKTMHGEIKVKDVCDYCNNVLLGKLDDYAKKFLEQSGVLVDVCLLEKLELVYDCDMLLRWLLKISYNAARQDGVQVSLFKDLVPYMLHGLVEAPDNIDLVLQLQPPVQHSAQELNQMSGVPVSACGKSNPFIARIGRAQMVGFTDQFVIRTVTMGAFIFYMFVHHPLTTQGAREQLLRLFIKNLKAGTILTRNCPSVTITAGGMDWINAYGPAVLRAKSYEV